jgi:glycosyltransferase involved in cell wall biosynthesis
MNNGFTFFSIVIPTYNRASMIGVAIKSVLAQDYPHWELIIIDDGSTDNTSELISEFKDLRIHYLKTENRERGAARNTGIKMAKGDFVAFLDSDDYLLANHLTVAAKIIKERTEIEFLHLNFEFRSEDGKLVQKAANLPPVLNEKLIGTNVIGCAGVVVKRELILEYLFSEDRNLSGTEDYELWLRIAAAHPIIHFPEVTTVMIEHKGRSMAEHQMEKTRMRILLFIELASKNVQVKMFLGRRWAYFCSCRYSYIALHAALARKTKVSIRFWFKAFLKYPTFCLSLRSLAIIKNIIT